MNSDEIVRSRIESRQNGEYVNTHTESLYVCGGSEVVIRPAGAVVESLTLNVANGRKKQTHAILYSDGKVGQAKRRASHIMSPAGPFGGLGDQHGAGRWLDWHTFRLNPTERGRQVAFQAKREDDGETFLRRVELLESQAWFESVVAAPYGTDIHTSLGEHWYFKMQGNLKDVAIDGKSLDLFTGDEEVYRKLSEGIPLHIPMRSPLNAWAIELPGQPLIQMDTQFCGGSGFTPTELWIWRGAGEDGYLCIEPVVGVSHETGELQNDLLHVEAGREAIFQTRIKALA